MRGGRFILSLLAVLPVAVAAQRPSMTLDAGGMGLRYADSVSATGATITPAISFSTGLATIGAAMTLSAFGGGTSWQGSLGASTFTPSYGRLTGEIGTTLGGSAHHDGARTGEVLGFARAHIIGTSAGGWTGAGLGRTWDGALWRNVRQLEVAGWVQLDPSATLVGTVTPSAIDNSVRYTDAQAALRWEVSQTELGVTAGYRAGAQAAEISGSSRAWGGVNVIQWVRPRTAIVASAGSYPLDFTQGFPAGRYVTLGVRLASESHAPTAHGAVAPGTAGPVAEFSATRSGSSVVFRLRAPNAQSVDVIGDFTQWAPAAMRSQGDGWWTLTLPVPPGTYQMNLRIDGRGWLVPPGLTSIRDEAGGDVGILIVR